MNHAIPVLVVLLLIVSSVLAVLVSRAKKAGVLKDLIKPPALKSATNVGEGFWPGSKAYAADAVISTRYLLGKIGSTAGNIAIAGAADKPIGVITDEAAAIGDFVDVDLLGSAKETKIMVASAAIAAGDYLMPAANGKVATMSASAGTYYCVGRALKAAAADGDQIEVDPIAAIKWVV